MAPTSEQRAQWGRIGAHVTHATHDSRAITAPARRAFLDRFDKQVDPDGVLDPQERAKRAHHAMQAHMAKLALKAATARTQQASRARQEKAARLASIMPKAS